MNALTDAERPQAEPVKTDPAAQTAAANREAAELMAGFYAAPKADAQVAELQTRLATPASQSDVPCGAQYALTAKHPGTPDATVPSALDARDPQEQVFTLYFKQAGDQKAGLQFIVADNFGQERTLTVKFSAEGANDPQDPGA